MLTSAFRAARGSLIDSSLVGVKIGETQFHLFARKKTEFAQARSIADLERWPILAYGGGSIKLYRGEEQVSLTTSKRIIVKDMTGIKQVVLGKGCIGVLPDFICSDSQSKTLLAKICPDWNSGSASFYALFASRKSLTPKNQAFLEYVKTFIQTSR